MKRNATSRDARDAFAATLTRLMALGQEPVPRAKPKRWTDESLAAALDKPSGKPAGSTSPRTVANWRKGEFLPETVEPLLAVFFGAPPKDATAAAAVRESYDRAQAEKNGSVFAEAMLPGLQWTRRGDQLTFQAGEPTDAAAAQDRNRRQLQSVLAEHAQALAEAAAARAARYGNMDTWKKLPPAAARFAAFIALPPEEIVEHLGEGYAACILLGRLANTDDEARRGADLPDPPLDRDLRDALTDVLRLAAPWLRGFPLVAGWDDDAGKLLAKPPPRESVEIVIRSALSERAIPDPEAEALFALVRAGDARNRPPAGPPDLAEKATRLSASGVTNLMLSLAEIEAAEQAGLLAPEDAEGRRLALRAAAVRRATQLEMEGFDLPDDVRATMRALAAPRVPKPLMPPVPVDNVQARAREMILRGVAPPAHWRPHILRLDFHATALADTKHLAGLIYLTRLSLARTPITGVAHLANLTGLRRLCLDDTEIIDVTPLAALANLTRLELRRTLVTSIAPLSALSALTRLHMRGTRITDISPLARLYALQMLSLASTQVEDIGPLGKFIRLTELNLSNTPVADAVPLAQLTGLTRLHLRRTKIGDASPLAKLTALTSLSVSETEIGDATPFANLSALKELFLAFTRITDASPLAKLAALENLSLEATAIVDLTPLAGLKALQRLDLRQTRVADLSPLASLTNLKTLRLDSVPDVDLAPLANLIANGLEIYGKIVPPKLRRKPEPA